MKKINLLIIFIATQIAVTAFAKTINCLDKASDKFICTQVIDLSKVSYINCLGDVGDAFEANLCEKITIPSDAITGPLDVVFNCLKDGKKTNDPYIIDRCSRLPNPASIVRTNCWGDLGDGYEVNLCENVNTNEQESIQKKLLQQK